MGQDTLDELGVEIADANVSDEEIPPDRLRHMAWCLMVIRDPVLRDTTKAMMFGDILAAANHKQTVSS